MNTFTWTGTVDSKGRVTIPSRIRNRLRLKNGERISLALDSGKVIREEIGSYQEALDFVQQFDSVRSFSFEGGVAEVVLDGSK